MRRRSGRACGDRRGEQGISLIEVLIAATLLLLTSMSMAFAFGSTGLASRTSDRELATLESLESTLEILRDQPYSQLPTWNGNQIQRGDHVVTIAANVVDVGLILVELVVTDSKTGSILSRISTYRAEDS